MEGLARNAAGEDVASIRSWRALPRRFPGGASFRLRRSGSRAAPDPSPLEIGQDAPLLAVVFDNGERQRCDDNEGDTIGAEDEDGVRAEVWHRCRLTLRPERRARLASAAERARGGVRSRRAWR